MNVTEVADRPREHHRETVGGRLLGFVLRPTAPPLGVGITVALGCILAESLLVRALQTVAPESTFGTVFLLGVLVVSAGWGMRLSVATSLLSALVYVHFHMDTHGAVMPIYTEDIASVAVFVPVALLTNILVGQARLRTAEAEQRTVEADRAAAAARKAQQLIEISHAEVSELAEQQAALRRVATLVARGSPPEEVYPAAVNELANGLRLDHVALLLFPGDGTSTVLASRDAHGTPKFPVGERLPLDGDTVTALVARTGAPARVDDYAVVAGAGAARVRGVGIRSAVGAPILVDGRVHGVLLVGSSQPFEFPPDTEVRVGDFADLVGTAITNAETRAALTASRARIVTAADQARRRFERDLHDGAQQRVISLGLGLRAVEASVPEDQPELRAQIGRLVDGLSSLSTELQEFSRGIHPAILSKGGLGPALRSLARRCPVPVDLEVDLPAPVCESVGVAAYYVVAEALTNAAKYARAENVVITATLGADTLDLMIDDDGVGGAVAGAGSGLIGLKDRVEALSGELTITSPAGVGTTITARIPLHHQ
ncbi:GAF domain-containing protein [Mycolicibacterium goodii]|uniref:histidine kinase n=1 Tax=Mycolicibacterium goodii TaxID=134601 RepID=A0A0K0WZE7_MYCGD|nr:histidine kinase [Mycolicibacterium goodii]